MSFNLPNSFCVVILSYNHPEHTQKCIESVIKVNPQFKVILVHNGSTEQHILKLQNIFPDIEHLILSQNRGFSGGANFGLQTAFQKYQWAFFITNDCELKKLNLLDLQLLEPGFYAPQIMIRNTNKVDSLGGTFIPYKASLKHNIQMSEINQKTLYIPGSAFLIDHDSFQKLNGFDETLGTYWEDVDLSQRAHQAKINLQVLDQIILQHKIGKTCRKDSYYTTYLYYRNQSIISRRHTPLYLRPILEYHLIKNWFKQSKRLIKQKRWQDLNLLKKSIFNINH